MKVLFTTHLKIPKLRNQQLQISRPMAWTVAKNKIDSCGFGSGRGTDFRGMPWEFHGYLEPQNYQHHGLTNFGAPNKKKEEQCPSQFQRLG